MKSKLGNQKIIACTHFSIFSTNRQINIGNENYYHNQLAQSSRFNKKHYYPVGTIIYLGILSEMRRGNRRCKFSFNKAVILKRILSFNRFPCISDLSVNAVFESLSIFYCNFLNLVTLSSFMTQKTILRILLGKIWELNNFK